MKKSADAAIGMLLVLLSCVVWYAAEQRVVRVGTFNYFPGLVTSAAAFGCLALAAAPVRASCTSRTIRPSCAGLCPKKPQNESSNVSA